MERDDAGMNRGITSIHSKGKSGGITLRRPVLRALGWHIGELVQVRVVDGCVVIRSVDAALRRAEDRETDRDQAAVKQAQA